MSKKLKNCKDCGKEISRKAKTCPNCGAKNKKRSKLSSFLGFVIIAIAAIIIIAGAGSSGETLSAKVNETVATDKFEITVTDVRTANWLGNEIFRSEPSTGGIYVTVQYTYKNISDEPIGMFSTPSFYLLDGNDVKYESDLEASASLATELTLDENVFSDLNPMISVNGANAFEVSEELYNKGGWKLKVDTDTDIIIPIN